LSWNFLAPTRLWFLLGVAAMAGAYIAAQFTRRKHVVSFTNVDLLDSLAPARPGWRRHVVAGCYIAAALVGVLGVAQPARRTIEATESGGRIVLTFDVSLSMEAKDVEPDRLQAAQQAALDFVAQVDDNIELGLVSFSGTVNVRVAPTLNHSLVANAIGRLELGEGTAIGDALVQSVEVVGPQADPKTKEPTGAIVLLSDGETTAGRPTSEGADAAAKAKIPVYAIAFGTSSGTVIDPDGTVVPVPVNLDELMGVADTTGGTFYAAPTAKALRDAYSEISKNLNAGAGDPVEKITDITWRYLAVALSLLALGWTLGLWWLRGLL
jgi:Ca-activated chloride channel homolog